jgi:hypothetical protein
MDGGASEAEQAPHGEIAVGEDSSMPGSAESGTKASSSLLVSQSTISTDGERRAKNWTGLGAERVGVGSGGGGAGDLLEMTQKQKTTLLL